MTGLIHCARCGTAMRGTFAHGTRYYRDPAREHGHSCTLSLINSDRAEAAVGAALSRLILPANWQERVLNLVESQLGEKRDLAQEKAKLTGQLERLKVLFTLGDLTEQEYLAGYLSEKGWFYSVSQNEITAEILLRKRKTLYLGEINRQSNILLTEVLNELLEKHHKDS